MNLVMWHLRPMTQQTGVHQAWVQDVVDYIENGTMLTNPPAVAGEVVWPAAVQLLHVCPSLRCC